MTDEIFLLGLQEALTRLPQIDWDALDPDLYDAYKEQIEWLLSYETDNQTIKEAQNKLRNYENM